MLESKAFARRHFSEFDRVGCGNCVFGCGGSKGTSCTEHFDQLVWNVEDLRKCSTDRVEDLIKLAAKTN